jgi:hypothetical protein
MKLRTLPLIFTPILGAKRSVFRWHILTAIIVIGGTHYVLSGTAFASSSLAVFVRSLSYLCAFGAFMTALSGYVLYDEKATIERHTDYSTNDTQG